MSNLILGVDAGNHRAKVAGPYGVDSYRTAICDWFARDIVESFGAGDDMEFEVNGRKGYAGTIAAYEDQFGGGAMYGDSKAHEDTLIRVLLAIYRYTDKYCPGERRVSIVTGQPIATHNEAEKARIIDMLRAEHVFTVNGERQRIIIEEVGVAAEGAGAFWANPRMGLVRSMDPGSGTFNCATIIDKRFINNASSTFNFGIETVSDPSDMESIARGMIRSATRLKYQRNDYVSICGGSANELHPYIIKHFPATEVLSPILRHVDGGVSVLEPVYGNAVGFYNIAKAKYR